MTPLDWDSPPDAPPQSPANPTDGWKPLLNPAQQKMFDATEKFVLAYGEKGCRTADTMIYSDGGLVRLGDLKPATAKAGAFAPIMKQVISFDGNKALGAIANGFWVEPTTEALRVEFANGSEFAGSPRHPIWSCWQAKDGTHGFTYQTLEDMQAGQKEGVRYWTPLMAHPLWNCEELKTVTVMVRGGKCKVCGKRAQARGLCHTDYARLVSGRGEAHPLKIPLEIKITHALAYSIGALVGDGSLNCLADDRSVIFTNIDKECIDRVAEGLAEIGCVLRPTKHRQSFSVIGEMYLVKGLIRELGIGCLSYGKIIPDVIVRSPKAVVAAFLRGLFDTDGTVEKTGVVSFCTTSKRLGIDVQDILAAFGILAIRRPRKSASGNPTWTISMNGEHAFKFGQEIGFGIQRKQARIRGARPSRLNPTGWNHNRYGYPKPISTVMRHISSTSGVTGNRAWRDKFRHLHSFKSVPARAKVINFARHHLGDHCTKADMTRVGLSKFMLSDTWLEVVSVTPTQAELFDLHVPGSNSFLASGTINHNSGKSVGGLQALVRHCYDNRNALAVILALSIRTGKEGALYDLENLVLPAWRDGNRHPEWLNGKRHPKAGELIDSGIGLQFTEAKQDPDTKDRVLWIGNRHGGWSKVMIVSIPYEEAVEARTKGPAPSFLYAEEITNMPGPKYFTIPAAQLGRRRQISGPMQYYASCNPEGPSHWVYQTWFVNCVDEKTGLRDKDYAVFHVPISENLKWLPPGYQEQLRKLFRDPIEARRLIDGEWVDRPSGSSIFKNYFIPEIHTKGDALKNIRIKPVPEMPIIVSMDPGPVNFSIHFEQMLPTKQRTVWTVFDELNFVGQYKTNFQVVSLLLHKMDWWQNLMDKKFQFLFVADEAAFTQVNSNGSYDSAEIERLGAGRIKLRGCPKGKESVKQRIQMVIAMLVTESLYVSASCHKTLDMLRMLSSPKAKAGVYDPDLALTPVKSVYKHPFDSMTYAPFYFTLNPGRFPVQTEVIKPQVYQAGSHGFVLP